MSKTVSVLGCGWLGFALSRQLLSLGYRVKGSTRSVGKIKLLADAGIEPFIVDLGSVDQNLGDLLQSHILIVDITSKDIDHFRKLLRAIENSPVEKVLFISSTSVYPANNKIVSEESETEFPLNPLVEIEKLFMRCNAIKTTIVRFAGLFGYDRKPGNFFRSGKIVSDPDAFVNMIHRDDCIALLATILEQDVWGEVFNACADSHPTKREFYTKAAEDIGTLPPTFSIHSKAPYKIVNNNKMKEQLGFICTFNDLMSINFASC